MPCSKALWKYKLFKKRVITSLFVQSDRTWQPSCSLCFRELQPSATPLAALCPGVGRCARQWQLTGTNPSAPGLPGTWTQKGSVSWKRNLPREDETLTILLEKPLTAFLQRAGGVCKVRYSRWCCSPYSSSGQGNATLQQACFLPGSRGSVPSYSASDSSPTVLPCCTALQCIAFPARRHCCITVQSSSKM